MQAIFTIFFAYFSTFELYVVYTGNIIDISAQQSSIWPKIDEVHFFFSRLQRQPTNQPPVRHSDPGTPLLETVNDKIGICCHGAHTHVTFQFGQLQIRLDLVIRKAYSELAL